jgi:hypothetical protein
MFLLKLASRIWIPKKNSEEENGSPVTQERILEASFDRRVFRASE